MSGTGFTDGGEVSFNEDTTESHERRTTRCRDLKCNARIIYLENPNGGKIPVDADTVEDDDLVYEQRRHVSHFKTCKNPNRFSKSRPR